MNIEPFTETQLSHLHKALGTFQASILELGNVDITKGRGVLSATDRCVWTTDGRRITITLGGGALVGSIGKNPDPECPK